MVSKKRNLRKKYKKNKRRTKKINILKKRKEKSKTRKISLKKNNLARGKRKNPIEEEEIKGFKDLKVDDTELTKVKLHLVPQEVNINLFKKYLESNLNNSVFSDDIETLNFKVIDESTLEIFLKTKNESAMKVNDIVEYIGKLIGLKYNFEITKEDYS